MTSIGGGAAGLRVLFRDGEIIDQPLGLSPNRSDLYSDSEEDEPQNRNKVDLKLSPNKGFDRRRVQPIVPDILSPGIDLSESRPSIGRTAGGSTTISDPNSSQAAITAHPIPIGRAVVGGRK